MRVFKDLFTGDELFSDAYRFSVLDDIIYEVIGNYVSINEDNEIVPSDSDEAVGTALNIVVDQGLESTVFDKKSFGIYLKMIFKKIKEHLEKNDPDRVQDFMKAAAPFAKKALGLFKDLEFYTGSSMNPEGVVVMIYHKDIETANGLEERPCAWVLKDAVKEEKY
ncbi:hypothetical protein P9112_012966 [Eukaryota sp. TZLM1-RC]